MNRLDVRSLLRTQQCSSSDIAAHLRLGHPGPDLLELPGLIRQGAMTERRRGVGLIQLLQHIEFQPTKFRLLDQHGLSGFVFQR